MATLRPRAALLAALVASSACTADRAGPGPGGEPDASDADQLSPPSLEETPTATPLDTVAIRGSTRGERVVSQGGPDGTVVVSVLPGGHFCRDIQLAGSGPTDISVYALADGNLSLPTTVQVTRDGQASEPANPTCSGQTEPECAATENCGNGTDDDCNGWEDDCDSACTACVDDALEPNDVPINVPMILPGSYSLKLCPCRDDWFAFDLAAYERLLVGADFNSATMNLNLRLFATLPGGEPGEFLVGSFTTTGHEEIDFRPDVAGIYYLRIYDFSAGDTGQTGSYQLSVE